MTGITPMSLHTIANFLHKKNTIVFSQLIFISRLIITFIVSRGNRKDFILRRHLDNRGQRLWLSVNCSYQDFLAHQMSTPVAFDSRGRHIPASCAFSSVCTSMKLLLGPDEWQEVPPSPISTEKLDLCVNWATKASSTHSLSPSPSCVQNSANPPRQREIFQLLFSHQIHN